MKIRYISIRHDDNIPSLELERAELERLGLLDFIEGHIFPAVKQDDGFTVSSEQKAAVALARQHGLKLYSTPVSHSSGLSFVLRVSVGASA